MVRNILNSQSGALIARGAAGGVSHVNVVQEGEHWNIVSRVRPPGFSISSIAVLSVCRELYNEAMGLLYSRILFCLDILSSSGFMTRQQAQPAMATGPSSDSVLMKWMNHTHVRQDIYPKDDLIAKADQLESLLGCMRPSRTSSDVSLHFKSVVNQEEWRFTARSELAWERYIDRLAGIDLGQTPELLVWKSEVDSKGWEPFERLASRIGG